MMKKIVSFFGEQTPIFVQLNRDAEAYAATRGLQYKWSVQDPFNRENVIAKLKNVDAGIIDIEPYGEETFREICRSCKILTRFGVGYDQVDLKAASRYHIAVARTTNANMNGVAEMAVTLMLSAVRQLKKNMKCVATGEWKKEVVHEISGSTVGILGFGAIGQRVATLLKGFNCHIIAYDPFPNRKAAEEKNVTLVSLEELFRTADSITIHVPYTEQTHHLVNTKLLSLMKPTAVLVNTAPGNIVDEGAPYYALSGGKIAGAGFDVFAEEPLPLSSPLLSLDNVILTPHVSSQTKESLWKIYKMAIDITADFFEGKGSKNILNPDYKDGVNNSTVDGKESSGYGGRY